MPQISVIVPLYNVERYVGDAVRSLQAQTFGDFEAILVDDGSTDETLAEARAAIGDDARFSIVQQANCGPATARNRGLSQARGVYVTFLDADDSFAPDAFAKLHARAQADDLDYLDFSARTVYEDARLRRVRDESFYEGRRDIPGVMSGPALFAAFQRNREYWIEKIEENIARDERVNAQLLELGWMPVHFWEKDVLKELEICVDRVISFIRV